MLHKYKPLVFDAKSKDKLLLYQGTYFYKQKWFSNINTYSIPILCSMALLVGIGLMVSPVAEHSVNAEEDYGISTQADATTLTLQMTSSTDSDGSTEITDSTAVAYRPYTFKAITNGAYRVYVQAASGYTGNLKGLANPREEVIGVGTNVVPGATGAGFPAGTWGYSLTTNTSSNNANLTYNTVPENGSLIRAAHTSNTAATGGQDFKLVFAAKIGDKPADHYQTKVLLSLAAGATEVVEGFEKINNMQQMTPEICAATPVGYSKQLIDTRDSKSYWVTKLKDNKCWMTQNLAFDITVLSIETGSSYSWNNNSAYGPVSTIIGGSINSTTWKPSLDVDNYDEGLVQSWNPGLWIYTGNASTFNSCGSIASFSACTTGQWRDVSNTSTYVLSKDPNMTAATTTSGSKTVYNAHYLTGNYYSFNAVTAGTGVSTPSNTDAAGSICPRGWRLPSAQNGEGRANDFRTLVETYGIAVDETNKLRVSPFYMVLAGYISSSSNLTAAGSLGDLDSATHDNGRYDFVINDSGYTTSYPFGYIGGSTVRCIAR